MSTPEQPANPPLTRKQLREIRNTGSTPVITPEAAEAEASVPVPAAPAATSKKAAAGSAVSSTPWQTAPPASSIAVAPLPRPAEPAVVPPAPVADATVDLGASPLTRRQARQQERIRTASVPVITPEVAAAHSASLTPSQAASTQLPTLTHTEPVGLHSGMHDLFGLAASTSAPVKEDEPSTSADREDAWSEVLPDGETADAAEDERDRVVNPLFGAGVLSGETPQAELPPSFDQLLARSTGAVSMPNALILSQAPEGAPISAPLGAAGEVLVTGTLNLPEGLGSTGHAHGTADGKEVDATLVDGELPAHSSPTPIAASAAISTVKTAGEVIRPPAPEKGSKLMLTLAITAGALALALVGVLILAFVTGAL
ncbi:MULTISPECIES: hypothetical protein [Microbacterium]|uniref:hypothetical protein n=1 Tax=Microbacterium TaxID=33882 RepID=UPI001469A8C8|nr:MULTISPECIES: hypothetical protein [Microbacterium]